MSEFLLSSADFSDLSDVGTNSIVITPACPICQNNYNCKIKPTTLQPCGHGLCDKCLQELLIHIRTDEDGLLMEPKCPICREQIVHNTPNYCLREITTNVDNNQINGFWEKQITKLDTIKGREITFSSEMRAYSKVICLRISFDDIIVDIKLPAKEWNRVERDAIQAIKNGFIQGICKTNDEFEVIVRWVGILAFPVIVETYLLRFFIQWYENRDFLESIDGLWLMDVITHPV